MISGVAQVIGMKPIFRSFFSSAPLVLRHRLQRRERQHAGDRGHRGAAADRAQEAAAQRVLREQRLDQRGLDEGVGVGLEVGGLAARAQLGGGMVGRCRPRARRGWRPQAQRISSGRSASYGSKKRSSLIAYPSRFDGTDAREAPR